MDGLLTALHRLDQKHQLQIESIADTTKALQSVEAERDALKVQAEAAEAEVTHHRDAWSRATQRLDRLDIETNALTSERDALKAALETAQAQLNKAADQFAFYADEHAKKRTPEATAKAMTNHGWALACAKAALTQPKESTDD